MWEERPPIDEYLVIAAGIVVIVLMLIIFSDKFSGASVPEPSRHVAKVRTFTKLLDIVEGPQDVFEAVGASITVEGCSRLGGGGWHCRGQLEPVLISGFAVRCHYSTYVYRAKTIIRSSDC